MLDRTDVLEQLLAKHGSDSRKRSHDSAIQFNFLHAFRTFKIVVDKCFGRNLVEGWEKAIENFRAAYLTLDLSITSKVHTVFDHVPDLCNDYGCGLGALSEHAYESLHRDFTSHWERHKVKDNAHPNFGERLKKTVCEYNASHL